MTPRDNVVSLSGQKLGGQRPMIDSQANALVADCRVTVGDSLRRLLQAMFDRLDDALYETADKAESHNVQFHYLDAMRDMRKQRASIESVFIGRALDRFDEFWRTGALERRSAAGPAGDPGELSLVGEDELEETLAINALVSKGESRFERQLTAIRQRFGQVVGRPDMADEDNPVGPAVLAGCFREAIGELKVELAVRLVVFKLFDRHVVSHLGALYDDINARFEKAGILASLNLKMRRPQPTTTVGGLSMPAVDPYAAQLPDGNELMGLLSNLLRGQRGASGVPMLSMPVVPTTDLLGALSNLQQTVLAEGPTTDVAALRAAQHSVRENLLQSLGIGTGPHASRTLGNMDEDVIDMVSMLFDFILDDRNLCDAMKALLSRLQIPVIRLGIVDRSFFGKKNHPARRLLNNLAKAGTGWLDDGDRSPKSLFGRIEAVVDRILAEFDTDPKIFEVVNNEFEPFLETELRGAAVAEERIRQVSRGQEQLKVARSRVTDVIEKRIWSHAELPEVVKDILRSGWKDVMLLALLREGEDSPSWKKSVDVVDRVVWSITPKATPAERQELLSAIPPLLAELKDGLAMISFDTRRSNELMKELQSCHIACLRGSAPPVPVGEPRVAEPPPVTTEVKAGAVRDDEFNAQALNMAVGTWMEWLGDDGQALRGKLSWRSEVTGTYIFVNRKGMKIGEMSVADVAELLRSERAQILEQTEAPLMERALAAMVSALKQGQEARPTAEVPA